MNRKIFKSLWLFSCMGALAAAAMIFAVLYGQFFASLQQEIRQESGFIAQGVELGGEGYLQQLQAAGRLPATVRVTLIGADGEILFDSQLPASQMENHADRPEVQLALQQGAGEAVRLSDSMQSQTFYHARRLADGRVLRVAGQISSVYAALLRCLPYFLGVLALCALAAAALAPGRTRRIVEPINRLDLSSPLANDTYEELAPLLSRIEQQNRQIHRQLAQLDRRRQEFDAIADHMNEGLLLLGHGGEILSANRSARQIFGIPAGLQDLRLWMVERALPLHRALQGALEQGQATQLPLERDERHYEVCVSPVDAGRGGAVLLAFDVTERFNAEQLRREFSANVSHELKTPLQSICGYAEIIANGLVKPEDVRPFAGRIHREAQRLIQLVQDIIRLSQLDEEATPPPEPVQLREVAQQVALRLAPAAQEQQVTFTVEGDCPPVMGVPALLEEMVYNLCENAVKYNRPGGRVQILLGEEEGRPFLAVEDTGIGIPPEHQARVFERFYRVDKSHSRQTGGTGLGLSIVKHGAQIHGAGLSLTSRVGQGSRFCLTFPPAAAPQAGG